MSTFKPVQMNIKARYEELKNLPAFTTKIDKDTLWNLYLDSFPEGTNEVFREKRAYDCNCCKNYIRDVGSVVFVQEDGSLTSLWDQEFELEEINQPAKALHELLMSSEIDNVFKHWQRSVGVEVTRTLNQDTKAVEEWYHFHTELSQSHFMKGDRIPTFLSSTRSNKEVLERSVKEIDQGAIDLLLELSKLKEGGIYRLETQTSTLELLSRVKAEYEQAENKDVYLWVKSLELKESGKFRNTSIGTFLINLSEGMDLEVARAKYEDMVAPHNYQRSKKVVTKGMIEKAEKRIVELGLMDSISRVHAVESDISITDVLHADRTVQPKMLGNVFDDLKKEVSTGKLPDFDKLEEVSIETFLKDILPKVNKIEALLENKHTNNLMTLIAPENKDAKCMLSHGNNFSHTYNGNLTDSDTREAVQKLGGDLEGILRCSISWNDKEQNKNDLDLHCTEPNGHEIYYSNKGTISRLGGMLDTDIVTPRGIAAENIIYKNTARMKEGVYYFYIHNFRDEGGYDWNAEIEIEGTVYTYQLKGRASARNWPLAEVTYHKDGTFTIKHLHECLEVSGGASRDLWNIKTNEFHKVNMMMLSPNHWDNSKKIGNKHWFFILDECKNPESVRGFYNEFLSNELREDRAVFEMLADRMKAPYSDHQLSGLGFSSTQRKELVVKVGGEVNKMLKIKF